MRMVEGVVLCSCGEWDYPKNTPLKVISTMITDALTGPP
jgi:hypothetical protein